MDLISISSKRHLKQSQRQRKDFTNLLLSTTCTAVHYLALQIWFATCHQDDGHSSKPHPKVNQPQDSKDCSKYFFQQTYHILISNISWFCMCVLTWILPVIQLQKKTEQTRTMVALRHRIWSWTSQRIQRTPFEIVHVNNHIMHWFLIYHGFAFAFWLEYCQSSFNCKKNQNRLDHRTMVALRHRIPSWTSQRIQRTVLNILFQQTYHILISNISWFCMCVLTWILPVIQLQKKTEQTRTMVAFRHGIWSGASRQRTSPFDSVFHDEVFTLPGPGRWSLHAKDNREGVWHLWLLWQCQSFIGQAKRLRKPAAALKKPAARRQAAIAPQFQKLLRLCSSTQLTNCDVDWHWCQSHAHHTGIRKDTRKR